MKSHVTISIDAMGGDHAPAAIIEGVDIAARAHPGRARFLLHGREDEIAPLLARHAEASAASELRHTDAVVAMGDKPAEAIRRSRGSSMWNAIAAVKAGEAQAAVSAGNTGALMAIAKVVLKMMADVHRPAIAASWPTAKGYAVVLDVGANVECGPTQLVEFAIMGEAFSRAVHGVARPKVGLLNVGAEDIKGNAIVKEASELLRAAHLDVNYHGFVEGDDICGGATDVVVTDGFTGNIALKATEGAARLLGGWMREALTSGLIARAGAALLSVSALPQLRSKMDPRNVNGGVFLGLNGVVVKSHGGTDGLGFATALRIAIDMARSDFGDEVHRNLARFAAADRAAAAPLETLGAAE